MLRLLTVFSCLSLISTLGCSMCASPHDCKFAAYGGLRERADQVHGRVGSILDPANELPSQPKKIADEPTLADLIQPLEQDNGAADGPVDVEVELDVEVEVDASPMVFTDVIEMDDPTAEFQPFGDDADQVSVAESDESRPRLVSIMDADPLQHSSADAQDSGQEESNSSLRLSDAKGNELPLESEELR